MAFGFFKILKGLVIKREGTITPDQITIVPNGTASTTTTIQSSQTVNRTLTLPDATTTLLGTNNTAAITNKTIDADSNTITNIENADIKAAAAIDATKIADGSVSSTEFQYINSVTSNVQDQLNAKEPTITVLPVAKGGTNSSTALNNNRNIVSSGGQIVESAAITADRALISDANGLPTHSVTTNSELAFVNGVTSAIQTQIDSKVAKAGDTMTGNLILNADPSVALGAATKQYVDSVAAGLDPKESVNVATTADLGATYATTPSNGRFTSAPTTLDGVALTVGMRILVKDQTDAKQNGIYTYTAVAQYTRAADMDGTPVAEVSAGNYTFTTQGTANIGKGFVVTGNGVLTLNTDNINWTAFSGASNAALRDLSNLTSPTAINQDLLPSGDNTRDLGASASRWNEAFVTTVSNPTGPLTLIGNDVINLDAVKVSLPQSTNDPSTPAEDNIYYNSVLDRVKLYDGTQWRIQATKDEDNFILNGYAESGTTGWAAYADAAQATPVDGTGGSPAVTITTTAVTPLSGQNSFLITKDAVNRQGQGVSVAFSIDDASKSKFMQISFDYIVNSGTFVASTGAADSDITVWIYDVTNGVLIQPSSYRLLASSTTNSFRFISNFNATSGSSYRLIFHCATTSAAAYALEIDNVAVERSNLVLSTDAIITDWQRYTPTTQGFGTITAVEAVWRRVGNSAEIRGRFTAGTVTAVEARLGLPSGLVSADTSVIPNIQTAGGGLVLYNVSSVAYAQTLIEPSVGYVTFGGYNAAAALTKLNGNQTSANGTITSFFANIPIAGWTTSPAIGANLVTQPTVAAKYTIATGVSASTTTPWNAATRIYDTNSAVTTGSGWRFTAPISGIYKVGFHVYSGGTTTNNSVYKNSVLDGFVQTSFNSTAASIGSYSVSLNSGDFIDVRPDVSATSSTFNGQISVERVSDVTTVTTINNFVDTFNSITNGDALTGVVGWATYADAAGAAPVDGAGGSPNVTFTRNTSNPLRGAASFIFAKDAANRQGQGASYDFTIDNSSKSKVLQIQFDSIVNSGTFVAGGQTTDSDVTVWVYDVTNARLIQPTTYKIFGGSTVVADKFVSNFQSSADSNSYRLIFHCSTTSANAYSLKIDNVVVSPTTLSYGTPITDWQNAGPITIGATTTAPTKGTISRDALLWRRVGNGIEVDLQYHQTTGGSAGSGEYLISLPAGLSIDTNIKPSFNGSFGSVSTGGAPAQGHPSFLGYGTIGDGTARGGFVGYAYSSTQIRFVAEISYSTYDIWKSSSFALSIATLGFGAKLFIPIQGWSAQVQSSDVNDQRIVSAVFGSNTANLAQTSGVNILFPSVSFDSHAAYTPATGTYRIPISGTYTFKVSEWFCNTDNYLAIFKNGTRLQMLASGQALYVQGGTATNQFVAGDLITFRSTTSADVIYSAGNYQCRIAVDRVANPASITSTETVAARYTVLVGATSSTSTPVNGATKVFDTHNAVTTGGSWRFTAPVRGLYRINTCLYAGSASVVEWSLYKNGSVDAYIGTSGNGIVCIGAPIVELNAGDYIDVRSLTSSTIAATGVGSGTQYIAVQKIGI